MRFAVSVVALDFAINHTVGGTEPGESALQGHDLRRWFVPFTE